MATPGEAARGRTGFVRPTRKGVIVAAVVAAVIAFGVVNAATSNVGNRVDYAGWRTPAAETSCVQWEIDMTPAQRLAMARTVAVGLGAAGTSDGYVRTFTADVTAACRTAVGTVRDVAGRLPATHR